MKGKPERTEYGQDAWAALREKFDGFSREALRAAHREMEVVKIRSDGDLHDFRCQKNRCRDRLNFVTSKKGPSNCQYEDVIIQLLPPEHDKLFQIYFEEKDCNLKDIVWMVSKIYAKNLNSDSSRGILGCEVTIRATGRDLSNINFHYCNKSGHYKNDCADVEAIHQQNYRCRKWQHKQQGGHQPHQPKPGGQQ